MIPGSSRSAIPVDVKSAAKYVGITQVHEVEMSDCDGLLSSTAHGTYIASLRKGQGAARKRFTLAHEVGHAIVYKSIGSGAFVGSYRQLRCRAETADQKDEERLCDVLAAELVMPRSQFVQTMEELGVCAVTVPAIAQRFGVSLQAASTRIAQILPYDVGIALWTLNEESRCLIPKWYLTKNGAMRIEYAIELGRPGSACFTDQVVRGWQWIPLQGEMDKYFVDVCPLGGAQKAWLVVVIFSDAAQHIITTISRGKPISAAEQMPLIEE
jgi:hypothetical protein